MKIDIGGGKNKKEGFLSLDIRNIPETNFVCNLETDVFPFENNSVEEYYSHHTFEHIDNIIHVLNEVWRTLSWDGNITIIVPHKDCTLAWQDPTHKRFFTEENMKFFCGEYLKKYQLDYGIKCCFKQIENSICAPDGRPEYFKEIKFVLKKDKEHYEKIKYPNLEGEKNDTN